MTTCHMPALLHYPYPSTHFSTQTHSDINSSPNCLPLPYKLIIMLTFNSSSGLLLLLFTVSFISISCTLSNTDFKCSEKDSTALLDMKNSFNNPSALSSWTNSTDCCTWNSVSCDISAKGRVTGLFLEDTDISGTISPSIGKLSGLTELLIKGHTDLTGFIPSSLGNLKKLTAITISRNYQLTGPIPKSLCYLPMLDTLTLSVNNLTGRIPGCLGANLTGIDLGYNSLSGSIPASFLSKRSSDADIRYLSLVQNRLSGVIPASVGSAPIIQIALFENQFTDARNLFGEQKKVKYLYLSENRLAFNLTEVVFPLTLEVFTAEHNKIYGSIPEQITKLQLLSTLDVSNNELCGPIPTGGSMSKFSEDSFDGNKCLCGAPLDPCPIV